MLRSFEFKKKISKKFQIDVGGTKREATVDDVIKIVEDLTRIH